MRILVDTNILFSAILFPGSKPATALLKVARSHSLFLCDQNLSEFFNIISRKAPDYMPQAQSFIKELSYQKISTTSESPTKIRDTTDQPILNAAILHNIDIILTGDKDFLSLNLSHPKCMTAAEFLELDKI